MPSQITLNSRISFGATTLSSRVIDLPGARSKNPVVKHNSELFLHPDLFRDLANYLTEHPMPVMVYGCSTGQEPYSLAMMLTDRLRDKPYSKSITGIDLSTDVIETAKEGHLQISHAEFERSGACFQRKSLLCYLTPSIGHATDTYQVLPSIRKQVSFRPGKIQDDFQQPVTKPSIVMFRRSWHYIEPQERAKLANALYNALPIGSIVIVGDLELSTQKPLLETKGYTTAQILRRAGFYQLDFGPMMQERKLAPPKRGKAFMPSTQDPSSFVFWKL